MPSSWYTPVGGQGGTAFQFIYPSYPVTKVETWTSSWLMGIRVTFIDGDVSPVFGKEDGTKKTLDLSYGERLTHVAHRTWGSSDPVRKMEGIEIGTEKGQLLNAMSPSRLPGSHYSEPLSLYSGLMVGIAGRADNTGVHMLGIAVLGELEHVVVDMNYLAFPEGGISDVSVNNYTLDNRQSEREGSIVIDDTESVTNSATTEKTWGESLGVSVSVSGKVFGIGADASTEFNATEQTMESSSYSKTRETHVGMTVGVPPGKKYTVTVLYYKGSFRVTFRPSFVLQLKGGHTVSWPMAEPQPISGVASGNLVTTVLDVTNTPAGEIPGPLPSPPKAVPVEDEDKMIKK
ncbi:hypothetical protein ACHAPC_002897 [Botrytis cinerea]|uniref:Putative zgc:174689 protein n=1 Tax=Botryotinia fuckeliana (strain BcDW1) TaxID=1290391 RepID=M7UVQ9_BOTF1|nr:putative zgc:174689 protein [Botrytis cinerea BcDW1]